MLLAPYSLVPLSLVHIYYKAFFCAIIVSALASVSGTLRVFGRTARLRGFFACHKQFSLRRAHRLLHMRTLRQTRVTLSLSLSLYIASIFFFFLLLTYTLTERYRKNAFILSHLNLNTPRLSKYIVKYDRSKHDGENLYNENFIIYSKIRNKIFHSFRYFYSAYIYPSSSSVDSLKNRTIIPLKR